MNIPAKFKQRKYLLALVILVVVLVLTIVVLIVTKQDNATQDKVTVKPFTAEEKATANNEIQAFSETIKPKSAYKDLETAEEKQAFLKREASNLGLLKPSLKPTPEALVESCLHNRDRLLSSLSTQYADHLDEVREELRKVTAQTTQNCYQSYAVDGKRPTEDMPTHMAH